MLLTIDIGNTNIKSAIFNELDLEAYFISPRFDDILKSIKQFDLKEVAISSVVPEQTKLISIRLKTDFGCNPFVITKDVQFNVKLKYNSINTLGIDRICSAEGAFQLNKKKMGKGTYLIIIDMGTAMTINFIKYPNEFIGGLISPGIVTMFKSLTQQTAQLPEITINDYKSFIGTDTKSSIASGVLNSTVGLIEKSIESISNLDESKVVTIYLTGGMAEALKEYLPGDVIYDRFLVLRGIKSVYDLNKKYITN